MKKEIRLYFNLSNQLDNEVYNYLLTRKSISSFIIDTVKDSIDRENVNTLIADKLDNIVSAIKNINIITTQADPEAEAEAEAENLLCLDLESFDDDY